MKKVILFFVLVLVLNSSYGKIEITIDNPDTIIGLSGEDFSFYGIYLGMSRSTVESLLNKQKHLSFKNGDEKFSLSSIEIIRNDINWKRFGLNTSHRVIRGWSRDYDSLINFNSSDQVVSILIYFTFSDIISESFSNIRFLDYPKGSEYFRYNEIRKFIGYPLFWKNYPYEEQYSWGKLIFDDGVQMIFHNMYRK